MSLVRIFRWFAFYVLISSLTSSSIDRMCIRNFFLEVKFIIIFICNNIITLLSIIICYFFLSIFRINFVLISALISKTTSPFLEIITNLFIFTCLELNEPVCGDLCRVNINSSSDCPLNDENDDSIRSSFLGSLLVASYIIPRIVVL